MLVSHRKKFIFTKTEKTAGTSVESYFEKYCMPEGEWRESHYRSEYISETGIIGFRGEHEQGATYYNHMPAALIREQIGADLWERYFKFTVIRNPYEKMISQFTMLEKRAEKNPKKNRLQARMNRILKKGPPIDRVLGKSEIERFRHWVHLGGVVIDRNKYLIDDQVCVDFFIRQESLLQGIRHVCEHLSIPFEPEIIPRFKTGLRIGKPSTREYYDGETRKIVEEKYQWELERFGYTFPQ